MSDAREQTFKHINRVGELMALFVEKLEASAIEHDVSKLSSPEAEMFDRVTGDLEGLTYGTPEYETQKKAMLDDALSHHYEHNSHHPEHYENGVDGMDLIDLVEMICDWRAATERHADGDIFKSIEYNTKRFNLSPQVAAMLRNTAERMKKEEW
jgi:hypothetical protein